MIRLFTAIEPSPRVAATLAGLQNGLPGADWLPAENLHLTLRFIGEVEEPLAEELHESFLKLSAAVFPLQIEGTGYFSTGKQPRTLWAGVASTPALEHLQAKLERACQKAGLEPEHRRFKPHVSLARVSDCDTAELDRFVGETAGFRAPSMAVEAFSIYESRRGKQHAHYDKLFDYPLIGALLG
jgi:RNA 2',3'-cyclic 3'-phosphodiesterase